MTETESVVPTEEQLDRLEGALRHIQAHPGEWDQSDWLTVTECGTAACLAGHVVLREGYRVKVAPWYFDASGQYLTVPQVLVEGEWRTANVTSEIAQELLGLDDYRAGLLFASSNTLPVLWLAFEVISGGARRAPEGAVTERQRSDFARHLEFYRADS
jgi:hypothetical protein